MRFFAGDDDEFQIELIVHKNQVREIADAQDAALGFANDARRNNGSHAQWRKETKTPLQIIFEHFNQGRAAASHAGDAVFVFFGGKNEAFFIEQNIEAAERKGAGLATDRAAGIAHDRDIVRAFGGENNANHFERDVVAVGHN